MRLDRSRDSLLTEFGKATLLDRYLLPEESFQDLFARVASAYQEDDEHGQRIYDYMSKHWFMPATPILSNGGTTRGLPISCFLSEATDDMEGIVSNWTENIWLASKGGGVGTFWGNIRSIGERVGRVGKTSGVVPFIKVQDSLTLAISQGSLRRGSAAVYMPIDHPEIEEFIEIRRPTGGDINRKSLNLHHGVVIPDSFMEAVNTGSEFALRSPKDQHIVRMVDARALWIRLLTSRMETGEPYMLFIDRVKEATPEWHAQEGLYPKTSNLCTEITLPTSSERTGVCCLSSVNLETYDQWKDNPEFIEDVMLFLDNVLQDFIDNAPETHAKAVFSASQERSIGLGVMGFHGYLQSKNIPIESTEALSENARIFKRLLGAVDKADIAIADIKGPCPDAARYAYWNRRFTYRTAIAPTASISIICGGSSPGVEPWLANSFTHKTLSGSMNVKNPYLTKLLEEKGQNTAEVWSSITTAEGSVQHLDFLSRQEKDVFKTAFEIDQMWLINLASDRQGCIDQSQSINIFLPSDVSKKYLHNLHMLAWAKGLKSLYYLRSFSIRRAESASLRVEREAIEECDSCQ